jgi:hypothetical protein
VYGQTTVNFFTVFAISFVSEALQRADLANDEPYRLRNDSETQIQQGMGRIRLTESLRRYTSN